MPVIFQQHDSPNERTPRLDAIRLLEDRTETLAQFKVKAEERNKYLQKTYNDKGFVELKVGDILTLEDNGRRMSIANTGGRDELVTAEIKQPVTAYGTSEFTTDARVYVFREGDGRRVFVYKRDDMDALSHIIALEKPCSNRPKKALARTQTTSSSPSCAMAPGLM